MCLVLLLPFEAQLLVETDTLVVKSGSRARETEFYLCMNRKGKLVGKVSGGLGLGWVPQLVGGWSSASWAPSALNGKEAP